MVLAAYAKKLERSWLPWNIPLGPLPWKEVGMVVGSELRLRLRANSFLLQVGAQEVGL